MQGIDSPGFGVDMDPSHIYRAGEDPVEALEAVLDRVGHVHIRDCLSRDEQGPGAPEMQGCGRGRIDLFGYLRVLHGAGIDVAANLEIIGRRRLRAAPGRGDCRREQGLPQRLPQGLRSALSGASSLAHLHRGQPVGRRAGCAGKSERRLG